MHQNRRLIFHQIGIPTCMDPRITVIDSSSLVSWSLSGNSMVPIATFIPPELTHYSRLPEDLLAPREVPLSITEVSAPSNQSLREATSDGFGNVAPLETKGA